MALTVLLSIGVEEDRGDQEEGNRHYGGEAAKQWDERHQDEAKVDAGGGAEQEGRGEPQKSNVDKGLD